VAANVAGLAPEAIHRGAVLTDGPGIVASGAVLAALRRPARLGSGVAAWPIASGTTLRLHIGTDQVDARVRRSRHETLAETSDLDLVRLVLDRPVALAVGDRFVLRHPSPGSTAAGGLVVDTSPVAGISRRRASAERLGALVASVGGASGGRVDGAGAAGGVGPVAALVDLHGVLTSRRAADMAAGLGLPPPDRPPGTRVLAGHLLAEDVAVALDDAALAAVRGPAGRPALERPGAAGLSGAASLPGALDLPGATGLPLVELRRALAASLRRVATVARSDAAAIAAAAIDALVAAERLRREGDLVRDPAARPGRPPELTAAMDRLELALSVASPPQLSVAAREAGCPPEGVRALESAGRLVRLEDDLAWAFATYRDLAALALRMADPGPLSPGAFRDATGSSRKYVLAILEDLDRRGLLQRTPDGHVLGPRAPRPAAR
jgi:selenocysteine-specific elongation factor